MLLRTVFIDRRCFVMKIVETILNQMGGLTQPKRNFILALFSTILIVCGNVNFTNLSRYSNKCEKTYRRHFKKPFPFVEFNSRLIKEAIPEGHKKILAIDCSFIPKSGKKTYGKDYFFNGVSGRAEKGLELSVISVIDVDSNIGYSLSVKQTPSQTEINKKSTTKILVESSPTNYSQNNSSKKNKSNKSNKSKGKKKKNGNKSKQKALKHKNNEVELSRIDIYLESLKEINNNLPPDINYLVADGYYSKEKFVTGVSKLNLNQIGKLRHDANMRYLYTGSQNKLGAKRKYDGKVKLTELQKLTFVKELAPKIYLYTAVVNHVTLKRNIRIAYIIDRRDTQTTKTALLFSTDTELDAEEIYYYYKARFQIEFIFRDAKQFTGLTDCQARDRFKLDFHFKASLTALNLAKFEQLRAHNNVSPFVFSMASSKRLAFIEHLLETFISKLDLDPIAIKNHPEYEVLLSYGSISA